MYTKCLNCFLLHYVVHFFLVYMPRLYFFSYMSCRREGKYFFEKKYLLKFSDAFLKQVD